MFTKRENFTVSYTRNKKCKAIIKYIPSRNYHSQYDVYNEFITNCVRSYGNTRIYTDLNAVGQFGKI